MSTEQVQEGTFDLNDDLLKKILVEKSNDNSKELGKIFNDNFKINLKRFTINKNGFNAVCANCVRKTIKRQDGTISRPYPVKYQIYLRANRLDIFSRGAHS